MTDIEKYTINHLRFMYGEEENGYDGYGPDAWADLVNAYYSISLGKRRNDLSISEIREFVIYDNSDMSHREVLGSRGYEVTRLYLDIKGQGYNKTETHLIAKERTKRSFSLKWFCNMINHFLNNERIQSTNYHKTIFVVYDIPLKCMLADKPSAFYYLFPDENSHLCWLRSTEIGEDVLDYDDLLTYLRTKKSKFHMPTTQAPISTTRFLLEERIATLKKEVNVL